MRFCAYASFNAIREFIIRINNYQRINNELDIFICFVYFIIFRILEPFLVKRKSIRRVVIEIDAKPFKFDADESYFIAGKITDTRLFIGTVFTVE